jgi:hypothetical protein
MADSIYTFDPTAASNTALDSIAYGPNQLYHSNIDNLFRAFAAKLAQHVDDLGGVNTVGGTANALTATIASGITAYATGQLFWFKNTPGPNTTATTMNVNAIGDKEIRLQGDSALEGGEMLDNGYYGLLYDAAYDGAAGGWILLNPATSSVDAATTDAAGIVELATLAETLAYTDATRAVTPSNLPLPTGYLYGLTLANGTDATNDINIAAGSARDASDSYNFLLGSTYVKQIDAAWALGSAAGGLDTGSVGNSRYAIWGIGRSDTRVCDALFSLSFSSPTMPANYDFKVLIGEFTRTGGVNGTPIWYGGRVNSGTYALAGPHVILEDQKAQNTDGGTFTSGADRVRTLNTEVYDPFGICSLSSDQFTLGAGTWLIEWSAPALGTDGHQSFLYNVTATAEVRRGTSEFSDNAQFIQTRSRGAAVVVLTASAAFEIRHRCGVTQATNGLGAKANFSTEVFTRVEITKVA